MNVKHVAKLANLPLKPGEEKKFAKQFADTLKTVDVINELDTSSIEPTSQVTGLTNVTRKDEIAKSRLIKIGDYFKVPSIFNAQ